MFTKIPTLIREYFTKIDVEDFTELDPEERAAYDEWQAILAQEVTLEDLTKFITSELRNLDKDLREAVKSNDSRKALLITARLENYEALRGVISTPEKNREALEAHLKALISKP